MVWYGNWVQICVLLYQCEVTHFCFTLCIKDWIQPLKRFVMFFVFLYDRTSGRYIVDEARKQFFTENSRALDNIPPTKTALIQHTRRVVYQVTAGVK